MLMRSFLNTHLCARSHALLFRGHILLSIVMALAMQRNRPCSIAGRNGLEHSVPRCQCVFHVASLRFERQPLRLGRA